MKYTFIHYAALWITCFRFGYAVHHAAGYIQAPVPAKYLDVVALCKTPPR